MGLKEIGCWSADWFGLALVTTAMQVLAALTIVNFCTSLVTTSL